MSHGGNNFTFMISFVCLYIGKYTKVYYTKGVRKK